MAGGRCGRRVKRGGVRRLSMLAAFLPYFEDFHGTSWRLLLTDV